MKQFFIALAIFTPWIAQSMESQVVQDTPAQPATEDAGRWVKIVEEVLPGEIPFKSGTNVSQIIAQKLLSQKPQIKQHILFRLSLPFKNLSAKPGKNCSIYFNPAGDKMATLAYGGLHVKLWDVQTGKRKHDIHPGYTINTTFVHFNQNGDKIVCTQGNTAGIWDTQTGSRICTLTGHKAKILGAKFNQNGDKILTWSKDRTVRVWDTQTGGLLRILWADTDTITFGAFIQADNKILVRSSDHICNIWDILGDTESRNLIQTLPTQTFQNITVDSFIHSETSKILDVDKVKLLCPIMHRTSFCEATNKILAIHNDRVKIWDAETGELLRTLDHDHVNSAKFSPTGHKILTIGSTMTAMPHQPTTREAKIWHSEMGELLHTLLLPYPVNMVTMIDNHFWEKTVTFDSTGKKILDFTYLENLKTYLENLKNGAREKITIEIWDAETGGRLHTFRDLKFAELDPTGKKLVTASSDESCKIWDLDPLEACKKFLDEDIGHLQAAILLDIFHVIETRHYANVLCRMVPGLQNLIKIEQAKDVSPEGQAKIARATTQLNKLKRAASLTNITFDFNQYPHLWYMYQTMPEAIKQGCDPYITKPSVEQDLKRSNSSPEEPSKRLKLDT